MGIRGVVDDQLGDDAQTPAMSLGYEMLEVLACPVLRVDIVVVSDVIPVILPRRRVEGQQPDRIDAEILDVIQLPGKACKIPYAIVIAVEERADVDFINDCVLVPKRIDSRLQF